MSYTRDPLAQPVWSVEQTTTLKAKVDRRGIKSLSGKVNEDMSKYNHFREDGHWD
jgi:hypothetical protein